MVVDFNLEEYLWGKCMGPTNMLRYMEFGGGMETCVQATELFIGNELLLPHLVSLQLLIFLWCFRNLSTFISLGYELLCIC